jgi:protein ImuA
VPTPLAAARLARLRRKIAALEASRAAVGSGRPLALGPVSIDRALRGGLASGSLHEIVPRDGASLAGALGFALALACLAAARSPHPVLAIEARWAEAKAGLLYAPGLDRFGLPAGRLLGVAALHPREMLWAMAEGLACSSLAAVLADLAGAEADLAATRRLALAAGASGGLGLLVRHSPAAGASAARTRWRVAPAPSEACRFGGLGPPAFAVTLDKNRHGPQGAWTIIWDPDACLFRDPVPSRGVAQMPADRPDRTRLALRAG